MAPRTEAARVSEERPIRERRSSGDSARKYLS